MEGRLDSQSDEDLVAALNRGDHAAFEVLYYRYRDWVVNLAFRFTRDRELALDVMQETFFYFVKKFPGFCLRAQLKTFFYPAVRNLSITLQRKSRRLEPYAEASEADAAVTETSSGTEGTDISAVLGSLTPEHREVLLLRFVDGMSMAEISEALEVPVGTVKSRLHNGLRQLREAPLTRELFE